MGLRACPDAGVAGQCRVHARPGRGDRLSCEVGNNHVPPISPELHEQPPPLRTVPVTGHSVLRGVCAVPLRGFPDC